MRNDILFAKRVIGIAACSSLSRKSWDDLCSKVIEPSLSKISKDKGLVVINGKSYQIEDISDNVAEELRRIGNNVNQMARAVNAGFVTEANLTETREELRTIWQSLNLLLRVAR